MKYSLALMILTISPLIVRAQVLDACSVSRHTILGGPADSVASFTQASNPTPPHIDPPHSGTENDRVIFWLHGLGGDINSWTRVANATAVQVPGLTDYKARKVVSRRLTYSQYALHDAAVDIQESMKVAGASSYEEFDIDPDDNILIGHSQGGVVARHLDLLYGNGTYLPDQYQFGGVVTFHSPNGGARIINNRETLLLDFVNKSCQEALAGPLASKIPSISLETYLLNKLLRKAKDKACDLLAFSLAPFIFKDNMAAIGTDYAEGAGPIDSLNKIPSRTPNKVAFYGIEETGTEFWREIYSLETKLPNEFPPFEADEDGELVGIAEKNILKSQIHWGLYEDLWNTNVCSWWQWIIDPPVCATLEQAHDHYGVQMDAWRTTLRWWLNANDYYLAAIGCLEDHSIDESYCQCKIKVGGQWMPLDADGMNREACLKLDMSHNVECDWISKITYQFVHLPNDGVVSAESQMGYPGAQRKLMPGSNHQQGRNDSNTKDRLKELFGGAYGEFFITDVR